MVALPRPAISPLTRLVALALRPPSATYSSRLHRLFRCKACVVLLNWDIFPEHASLVRLC